MSGADHQAGTRLALARRDTNQQLTRHSLVQAGRWEPVASTFGTTSALPRRHPSMVIGHALRMYTVTWTSAGIGTV